MLSARLLIVLRELYCYKKFDCATHCTRSYFQILVVEMRWNVLCYLKISLSERLNPTDAQCAHSQFQPKQYQEQGLVLHIGAT